MRFRSIDALRGLAALMVVVYHIWNRYHPGLTPQSHVASLPHGALETAILFLFGFGYLGVNLFFVLSGFCIHLPQALRFEATGDDGLKTSVFAERRFWRLYPAYFASLVWTSLVLVSKPLVDRLVRRTPFHLMQAAELKSFAVNAVFLQQIWPGATLFNGVYWTLVFEVQFYLLYPLLLRLCRRVGFGRVLLALLICELALAYFPVGIPLFFAARYFEWFLGMYLAENLQRARRIPRLAFPFLLALAMVSVFRHWSWRLQDVLASAGFAALLGLCVRRESSWRLLTGRRLVSLGIISYSLYLIHVPMIDLFWDLYRVAHRFSLPVSEWMCWLSIPGSIAMASLFYRWFEEPFLRGRPKRARPPEGVSGLAGAQP